MDLSGRCEVLGPDKSFSVLPGFVKWETRPDISPLRYPGGKRKLAPFVADVVVRSGRRDGLFVEPFAGGAAVSISLLEAGVVGEIALADADPLVSSFWQAVFSPDCGRLAEMASSASLTLEEWKRQKFSAPADRLTSAYKCLYLNRTSFSGSIMDYAGPMGGKAQEGPNCIGSRFNREAIASRIMELGTLRERVRFVGGHSWTDAVERVRSEEAGGAFWYLDPPFFAKARRLYQHSFSTEDHAALAQALDGIPGNWILSYDDHPQAVGLYGRHPGFARIGMRYNLRVDGGQKPRSEIVVSDVIAKSRSEGCADFGSSIVLQARRKHAPGLQTAGKASSLPMRVKGKAAQPAIRGGAEI